MEDYKYNVATTLVTAPAVYPLSLAEAKEHLRVTSTDENNLLTNLIKAVTLQAEELTGCKFITQTWKAFYNGWPDEYFVIPYPPLQSVTHIKYKNTAGTQTAWNDGNSPMTYAYIVDTDSDPGRVVLGYDESWPSTTLYPSIPIEIQFICGYGLAASVPEDVKTMLKIGLERLYDRPHESYDKLLKDIWEGFIYNKKDHRF